MPIYAVDEINETRVHPDLLKEVIERIANLDAGDRGFEASTITAVHVVSEMNLDEELRGKMIVAVNFRLMALSELIEKRGAKGWTKDSPEDGAILINEEVLACAAVQPLIEVDDRFCFDPEDFSKGLLANTNVSGNA